jgi:hypothetical protein
MPNTCRSAHRCSLTTCHSCTWRYALHVSRRVYAHDAHRIHSVSIDTGVREPSDFPRWRIALRNMIDHLRRSLRWWREVGLWLWLHHDGSARGVILLGSVTEPEFIAAIGRRWTTTLRLIETTEVRVEIYQTARPGSIALSVPGRFQRIKVVVEPQGSPVTAALSSRRPIDQPVLPSHWHDGLPVLL